VGERGACARKFPDAAERRARHNEARSSAVLKRRAFLVMMRWYMRACIRIHRYETARVGSWPRAPRCAAIAALLIACHLANTACIFDATAHAQGLTPQLPADPDPSELVRAQLVADVDAIAPGKPFRLAVRLEIKEGWHVNWLNPGDAGLAPGVEWRVPAGFKTTVMCWPYPERFETGPLVIFGYAKELILVTEVTPLKQLGPEPVKLGADVTWLACEEACIPGSATLSVSLPVEGATRRSQWSGSIESWLARCPVAAGAWNVDASVFDDAILLDLQTADEGEVKMNAAFFYPLETGVIENSSPQLLSVLEGPLGRSAYQLRVPFWRMATSTPERVRGVLVMDLGSPRAIEVDVPLRKR